MKKTYVPDRGDIVWLNFDPASGHEQQGKRPAVVISPKAYNQKTGLGLFCPITSKIKNYPFEVKIDTGKISGVILSDQISNLDWNVRDAKFITKAPPKVLEEVIGKAGTLIF